MDVGEEITAQLYALDKKARVVMDLTIDPLSKGSRDRAPLDPDVVRDFEYGVLYSTDQFRYPLRMGIKKGGGQRTKELIEEAVKAAMEILNRRKVKRGPAGIPDSWEEWDIPATFEKAEDAVSRNKKASISRLVRRFQSLKENHGLGV